MERGRAREWRRGRGREGGEIERETGRYESRRAGDKER